MKIVRLLEDHRVVKSFGVALALAPFINTLLFMLTDAEFSQSMSWQLYFKILFVGPFFEKVLSVLGFILGLIMLSGQAKFWKFVLGYLGLFIAFQITNLGTNLRASWIHGFFFLGNIGAFLFIADQLVWKQQKPESMGASGRPALPKKAPQKIIKYFTKKIYISIPGLGKSGQIVNLSKEKLQLRLDKFPENLKLNSIFEFKISKVAVKARVKDINHQDVTLEFENDSAEFARVISKWQSTLQS